MRGSHSIGGPLDPKKDPLDLQGEVALNYYRLTKISEGSIELNTSVQAPIHGPMEAGTRKGQDDVALLSEIIDILNDRFGTNFSKIDQLLISPLDSW